jgi:type I restriction enzyme S subunit
MSRVWPMVPLGEILTPVNRPEDVDPEVTYHILGAHWYAEGLYTKEVKPGSQIQAAKVYRVEEGDFVYNRLFAWKGSFAVAARENHGCYVSNEFPCFAVNRNLAERQYLWKYFSRTTVWDQALGLSSGGTPTSRNRLKEEKLLAMMIPLPPLSEQRRIVARIEELAAKIEEARGLRRQAVEDVELLLQRAVARIVNKERWPEIPLRDLLREDSQNGLSPRPSDTPPGIPILRISAVTSRRDATVEETDFKYLQVSEREAAKYRLDPGDLLACRFNGNLHYVGRFALYRGYLRKPTLYPDKLIRFRVDTEKILPEFARFSLNSPKGRAVVESLCATTAGNIGISAGNLKTAPVPVPPLPEQYRIVAYLDSLQAKVDMLKRLQAETATELDALLPSVLDKAFKGEL